VPKVLVITSYGDTPSFFDWIHQEDGPDGALSKIGSLHEVKLAIVQVLTSNNKYFSPRFLMREQGNSGNPLTRLTPRELQVLRHVAVGDRLVHIAERYDLSYETVHGYMNNIYCKLNVRPRTLQGAATLYNQWIHAPLPPLDGESL
jgi:DNA-binding NarL/FixJ family response regulator